MKLREQLRTLWYSFWMWNQVVPATKSVEYNPPTEKPYWIPMVASNSYAIAKALGIKAEPQTEDEARTMYLAWCEATDAEETARIERSKKPLEASFAFKGNNDEMSKCLTRANTLSPIFDTATLRTYHQEEPRVWIYNASRMEHSVDSPHFKNVRIPANTTSKRYAMWTSLPSVVTTVQHNLDTNETYGTPMRGDRLAMDLINPDNLGLDQNEVLKHSTGVGRNLGDKGVFWSLNNPPHRHEVTEAVKRMEKRYKMLLEKAAVGLAEGVDSFEDLVKSTEKKLRSNYAKQCAPKDRPSLSYIRDQARRMAQESFSITPEHHAAADHFRITTEWHPILGGKL